MTTLKEIAENQTTSRQNESYDPGRNLLFRYLYDAYCHFNEMNRSFDSVRSDAASANAPTYVYEDACRELSDWYMNRYKQEFNMPSGSKGISRAVNQKTLNGERTYRFDQIMERQRFKEYLVDSKPISNGDAYDFLLHTAVAFELPEQQLDELLNFYGFHPLHIKNIHHLAIYTVLRAFRNKEIDKDQNPFQAVRKLYDDAQEILMGARRFPQRSLAEGEAEAFASGSTRMVRQYITGQNSLSRDELLSFIQNHAEIYDMRHHRLLAEHKRMVDLFSELYMERGNEYEERDYSLYCFLTQFCKSFKRKEYKDHIYRKIEKDRHPTREFMIILWIYSYCFLFYPRIMTERNYEFLVPFGNSSSEECQDYPFGRYIKGNELDVLAYLSDESVAASPLRGFCGGRFTLQNFSGSAMIAYINKRLKDYSWRQLDVENEFDRVIKSLEPFRIGIGESERITDLRYGGKMIDGAGQLWVDNVPAPLAVITAYLKCLKESDLEHMPLACSCYEFI